MSLSELILRPRLSGTIARLEAEHQAAQSALEAADQRWREAVAGEGGPDDADWFYSDLEKAQRTRDKAVAALAAARERHALNQSASTVKATAEKWAKAVSLAETREKQAAQMAQTIEAFATSYHTLQATTAELLGVMSDLIPGGVDDGALLWPRLVEQAVREELVRLGLPWAFPHPWGRESMHNLLDWFRSTVDAVKQWRADHLDRK